MKLGKLVIIRPDLEVGKDYGNIHVFDDMKSAFGRVGAVMGYDEKENAVKVCGWWWSTEAVMPIKHERFVLRLMNIIYRIVKSQGGTI